MARIYTRTGDKGDTYCMALRSRVAKDHPLIEFMGSLDEANSALGLAADLASDEELVGLVRRMQRMLFNVGFHLSGRELLSESDVDWLERIADEYLEGFEFKGFILPGGSPASSALHLARSILRRAERRLVTVRSSGISLPVGDEQVLLALKVLNRMSDALYALAIHEAQRSGKLEYL